MGTAGIASLRRVVSKNIRNDFVVWHFVSLLRRGLFFVNAIVVTASILIFLDTTPRSPRSDVLATSTAVRVRLRVCGCSRGLAGEGVSLHHPEAIMPTSSRLRRGQPSEDHLES